MFHMKLSDFKLCDMPDNCILPPGHAPVIDTGTYSPLLEQIFRTMFDECSRRDAGYEQLCHGSDGQCADSHTAAYKPRPDKRKA